MDKIIKNNILYSIYKWAGATSIKSKNELIIKCFIDAIKK